MRVDYPVPYRIYIIISAFIVYIITAYFSVGYFHPDEHFQLLEFANYKMGNIAAYELPWEYAVKIRPTFQPWVAYVIMRTCNALKVDDPYLIALILRMLTAVLAVTTIDRFARANMDQFKARYRVWFYFLSFFLWFLPIVSIRFSSESWSGLLFMLALARVNSQGDISVQTLLKVGLLIGFSFLCRFQSGIMTCGLCLWLLSVRRVPLKSMVYLLLGWISVLVLGILLDRLFYGSWTLTPWNYFHVNIIMDIASDFGKVQWYRYVSNIILEMIAPIGIIILMAFLILLVREPKNKIIWVVTPFLFVHLIIPHKETRFLFPVAGYLPYALFMAFQSICCLQGDKAAPERTVLEKVVFVCFLATNTVSLITSMFILPANGRIAVTKFIYDHYKDSEVRMYTLKGNNPFTPFQSLRQSYYDIPQLKCSTISNYSELEDIVFVKKCINLLVVREKDLLKNQTLGNRLAELEFKEVILGSPKWATTVYAVYNGGAKLSGYKLYMRLSR